MRRLFITLSILTVLGSAAFGAPAALTEADLVAAVENLYEPASGRPVGSPSRTSGTTLLLQVHRRWKSLSLEARMRLEPLLSPPSTGPHPGPSAPTDWRTALTTHFQLAYATQGPDAVPVADADGNGVPDYVDEAGRSLEAAWVREIGQLGFAAPGKDRLVVGFANMKANGLAHPAQEKPAWIELSTELSADADKIGRGLLRATCAHEFFHIVQFGYSEDPPSWWLEGTAMWMEKQVFPDSSSYLDFADLRQEQPYRSLTDEGEDNIQYSAVLFALFLEETHGGPDAIRKAWEGCRTLPVEEALTRMVKDVRELSLEFACHSYLGLFRDQRSLAPAKKAVLERGAGTFAPVPAERPQYLGYSVVEVEVAARPGALAIDVQGSPGTAVRMVVMGRPTDGPGIVTVPVTTDGTYHLAVPEFGTRQTKVAIVVLGTVPGQTSGYTLTASTR